MVKRSKTRRPQAHESSLRPHERKQLERLVEFPLTEALFNRRSRRFFRGAEIPDGPLAYKSKHKPLPLSDLERLLVLVAVGGVTGWSNLITRHDRYAAAPFQLSGISVGSDVDLSCGISHQRDFLHR